MVNHSYEFGVGDANTDLSTAYDTKLDYQMENNLRMMHSDYRIKTEMRLRNFRESISQKLNKYGGVKQYD